MAFDPIKPYIIGEDGTELFIADDGDDWREKVITAKDMNNLVYSRLGETGQILLIGHSGNHEWKQPVPDKAKCAYCGQWGEPRSECKKCGAPIDPLRATGGYIGDRPYIVGECANDKVRTQ